MVSLKLHAAELVRSFAKFGIMDPYVIVHIDDQEVHRTAPARWAHKTPQWESQCSVRATSVPSSISLSVWNANRLRRDVFCGSVTIPCSIDMSLVEKEFALTKRGAQTGTVRISLKLLGWQAPPALPHEASTRTVHSALGAELDNMGSWLDQTSPVGQKTSSLTLAEPEGRHPANDTDPTSPSSRGLTLLGRTSPNQKAAGAASPAPASQVASARPEDQVDEVLARGSWTCVATTGLEEFLKHTGIGTFQRKLAMAARWPSWEFKVTKGNLHFLNHSAMGDLHEDIRLDGQTYEWKDGRGNLMSCTATWEKTAEGGILRISRTGAIATYSEERRVEGDTLTFSLTNSDGAIWGRVFNRAA